MCCIQLHIIMELQWLLKSKPALGEGNQNIKGSLAFSLVAFQPKNLPTLSHDIPAESLLRHMSAYEVSVNLKVWRSPILYFARTGRQLACSVSSSG